MSYETKQDQIFRSGFEHARADFSRGLTVEQILKCVSVERQNVNLIEGVQAFADLYLGWSSTRYARKANELGLAP